MPMCDNNPESNARWMCSSLARLLVALDADLLGRLAQLADEVLPLAHAQEVQVLGLEPLAELAARQLALLLAHVGPQVEIGR